jgi:hypothetical protein
MKHKLYSTKSKTSYMTTQALIPLPNNASLEAENEALRAKVRKLEEMVLAYRNERSQIIQWVQWLRGHVSAGASLFEQPSYIAEVIHGSGNNNQGRSKTGSPALW